MKKNKKYAVIFGLYSFITISAIYFSSFTRAIAAGIAHLNLIIDNILGEVLNSSALGIHCRHILSLALTPLCLVAIPVGIYWFIKKTPPPYLIQIIWVLWIITALSRLLSQ